MLFGLLRKLLEQKPISGFSKSSDKSSSTSVLPLAFVAIVGGLASCIRTMSVNFVEDRVTARLRTRAVKSLLTERDLEWFQNEQDVNDQQGFQPTTTTITKQNHDAKENGVRNGETKSTKRNDDELIVAKGMTPGAIGTILDVDTPQVAHAVASSVTNGIRSACSCVFGTYRMLQLNPTLLGTSVCILPLMGIVAAKLNKVVKQAKQAQVEAAALASAFCEERLTHIAMVKMSSREEDEARQYEKLQNNYVTVGRRKDLASGMFMGFMFTAGSGALFFIFHLGGRSVASGHMTSGQLAMFGTNSFMLALGAAGVMRAMSEISESLVCARRVYRLIDGPAPEEEEEASTMNKKSSKKLTSDQVQVDPTTIDGIQMINVSFAYKSHPDTTVLRNVSLELKRGKIVALVGKNGSGKSTVASLLGAMYEPTEGQIVLPDGTDYNQLDRQIQKRLIQIVPQEPALFNTSILENVRYSQPTASEAYALTALHMANCDTFLSKLEDGIYTAVGQNGSRLSSGQRQRLGLARALLSDPPILVLDEPQSSLDAEGESAVMDAIQACRCNSSSSGQEEKNEKGLKQQQGRALLLITHNAKSLQHVDEIIVLQDGQVVETGAYAELSSNPTSALCQLMPDLKL